MKAKLNKNGLLSIERAGEMRPQYCPFSSDGRAEIGCGDWCPLFVEPYEIGDSGIVELSICNTILTIDYFADERNKPDA